MDYEAFNHLNISHHHPAALQVHVPICFLFYVLYPQCRTIDEARGYFMASRETFRLRFQPAKWPKEFSSHGAQNAWNDCYWEYLKAWQERMKDEEQHDEEGQGRLEEPDKEEAEDKDKDEKLEPLDHCLGDPNDETRERLWVQDFCKSVDWNAVVDPSANNGRPVGKLVRNAMVSDKHVTPSGELRAVQSDLNSPLDPNGLLRRLQEVCRWQQS
jgi:hypothetical protein